MFYLKKKKEKKKAFDGEKYAIKKRNWTLNPKQQRDIGEMWECWAHRRTRKLEMNTISKKNEMQRRQKNNESVKERSVTGRSGSCIQKELFTLNFLKKQTKIIYIIGL